MFPATEENSAALNAIYIVHGINPDDPVDRHGLDGNDESDYGEIQRYELCFYE